MSRPPRPPVTRHNLHPPRRRLQTAAAALPRRHAEHRAPSGSFERDCPACGRLITSAQVHGDTGVEYAIKDHGCV